MNYNKGIGIVFDLDGVITDTAKLHFKGWEQESRKLKMKLTSEQNDKLRGLNRQKTAIEICKLNNVTLSENELKKFCDEKNAFYKELLRTELDKSFILGGFSKTLPLLKEEGFLLAIASSSHNAPSILKKLDLEKYFVGVVDPSKVIKHKPDPEMYLKGAKILNTKPERTIGVEDAPSGIVGIIAAKMISVAVKWTTLEEDFKGADYIVKTSSDLTVSFFKNIVKEKINEES